MKLTHYYLGAVSFSHRNRKISSPECSYKTIFSLLLVKFSVSFLHKLYMSNCFRVKRFQFHGLLLETPAQHGRSQWRHSQRDVNKEESAERGDVCFVLIESLFNSVLALFFTRLLCIT